MDDVSVPGTTGRCGLNCSSCQIFLATRETDPIVQRKMREEIAETIRSRYGKHISAEKVNDCDGCRSNGGRIFSGCLDCQIRKCAIERRVKSCAFCPDYACDKLQRFMFTEAVDQSAEDA